MKYIKLFESFNDIEYDIEYVKDILLELDDMGFYTTVSLTPLTQIGKTNKPYFFIDIKKPDNWLQFYDNDYPLLNKQKEFIDSIILHSLEYLEERKYYAVKGLVGKADMYKPTEFKFLNNPTSYQIVFTTL